MIIDFHTHIFSPEVTKRRETFIEKDFAFSKLYGSKKAKIISAPDLIKEMDESGIDISVNDSGKLSFSTKRNLLTNSAEFYNLSYEYINDCLKAGIVFRREFYTDRDIEPDDSIMFKISILPFGNLNSPTFSKWK